MSTDLAKHLRELLIPYKDGAIAVSGGVDSMTLAAFAQNIFGSDGIRMVHALSPAVPKAATSRLRQYSAANGWNLIEVDAGEFSDLSYRTNPVNRCFYCKTNLYKTVRELCDGTIMSGTNCDDLEDYRPGLTAAKIYGVRHPYVEAGMDKLAVRTLARELGLSLIAELPASPCLSSRIETGIPINIDQLNLVDALENWLRNTLKPKTVRCRIRRNGLFVELDMETLNGLSKMERKLIIENAIKRLPPNISIPVNIAPYQRGSAFVDALTNTVA